MSRFVGQIALLPYAFAPAGWLECNGVYLPIAGYEALYNLIGTRFGGSGSHAFVLPDLRKEAPCEGIRYFISLLGAYPTEETEYLRGWLTPTTRYRLLVTGDVGTKEIDNIVRALEIRKQSLIPKE